MRAATLLQLLRVTVNEAARCCSVHSLPVPGTSCWLCEAGKIVFTSEESSHLLQEYTVHRGRAGTQNPALSELVSC